MSSFSLARVTARLAFSLEGDGEQRRNRKQTLILGWHYTILSSQFINYRYLNVLSYSRWITLTLPKTAWAEGVMRLSIPWASADSLLLTVTASSWPLGEVRVLIFTLTDFNRAGRYSFSHDNTNNNNIDDKDDYNLAKCLIVGQNPEQRLLTCKICISQ